MGSGSLSKVFRTNQNLKIDQMASQFEFLNIHIRMSTQLTIITNIDFLVAKHIHIHQNL
jgi:hypothetical protein